MYTGDGHIVQQCISGNTDAFALLVDKYQARIFALVYAKVGQFQDAEDLTQEVFLNAYKKLSTLRRWDNFYPWLYSIAANRCKDFHRDKKRRIDTVPLADPSENHRADMEAHAEKLKIEQLHDALASLPEIHRQVLVLRYMAGMKSKEIAQTLRVSPNTINQRLRRAREKLKTVLNEEMIPMMSNAFADRKLQPGFTSRVAELIKETKIQTPPHKTALPLGLSAVGGVIILLLSLSLPQNPLYPIGEWIGSPLPLKTQVVENGEMAVDAEVTKVTLLADAQVNRDFGQNRKPLQTPAAIGEGEEDEKEIAITGVHLPADYSWDVDISPDGTHLVHAIGTLGARSESNLSQLVLYPLVTLNVNAPTEQRVILEEPREIAIYWSPRWSPDRKWIAFYRLGNKIPETEEVGKDTGLYLISSAGGVMRFLAQTHIGRYPDGVPTSADLSWSPDSRKLAFLRRNGKDKTDIYIVSLNTGEVRPVTTDGKENSHAFWSPDGKWVCYSSDRGGWFSPRLWRQPVDGGKAVGIRGFDVGSGPPIHSPDKKWMVYTDRLPDGKSGFLAARVNEQGELTGEPILLKEARLQVGAKPLRWTPDGQLIVLQEDYREMTYTLNIKNGEQRRVSSDPEFLFEYAQWLSDGKRLFLVSREDQHPGVFDIETGQFTELPIELPEGSRFGQSTLSPDGKWVAFVQIHLKTPQEAFPEQFEASANLSIMPVTGGTAKPVTSSKFFILHPRWSPDGQKIAFLNTQFGASGLKSQLRIVSVSDGQVTALTDSELCMEPAWSPDGTMLAYLQLKRKGNLFDVDKMDGDLYIVPARGGESKQITSTPEKEMEISWTPDGKRLTFKMHGETWVVSIDGGNPQKLPRGYIPLSWASDGASYLAFGHRGELQRISPISGYDQFRMSSPFSPLTSQTDRTSRTPDSKVSPILASERPVQILQAGNTRPLYTRSLSISPDGETILFQQTDTGTQCWRIDVSHLVGQ